MTTACLSEHGKEGGPLHDYRAKEAAERNYANTQSRASESEGTGLSIAYFRPLVTCGHNQTPVQGHVSHQHFFHGQATVVVLLADVCAFGWTGRVLRTDLATGEHH